MSKPKKVVLPDEVPTDISHWALDGVPCSYVQFRTKPIPPAKGKEPQWELKLDTADDRYKVDSIVYAPQGLIFTLRDEQYLVPISNVAYVRPL